MWLVPMQGWWSYQLCYQRHLTQFHADDQAQVDWAISMGAYASSQWAHPGTKAGAVLFPGRTVRYIPQVRCRGLRGHLLNASEAACSPTPCPALPFRRTYLKA